MIRLFNTKLKKEILIDDKSGVARLTPKYYDVDIPHVLIELYGIDLFHHSRTCEDCDAFVKALGSKTHDWFIDIDGKINRLNLYGLGQKYTDNHASQIHSYFFNGTKLKLNLDTDTVDSLQDELNRHLENEEFEKCCFYRDKIKALQDEMGNR